MLSLLSITALFIHLATGISIPRATDASDYDLNRAADAASTTCGDIVTLNYNSSQIWFYASDALDCLTSLPFNKTVATKFISWYSDTLQFHSTTAYLKNPPSGYQPSAIDLFGGLQSIQDKINADYYKNEYAFEADVQTLLQQSHDGHLALWSGAMQQFTFSSPFYLTTLSTDGYAKPKTYFYNDIVDCAFDSSCAYSAVSKINDQAVVDFLTDFAKQNSFGFLESHADFNNLMFTPAQEIIAGFNAFSGSATFYPGDTMKVAFENGTSTEWRWLALYDSPRFTGPLNTSLEFYNVFVLGQDPPDYNATLTAYLASLNATDTDDDDDDNQPDQNLDSWKSVSSAYPDDTMSHQVHLGVNSPGFVTGYYFDDISTAVLSIPSFIEYGDDIGTFSTAVGDFKRNASAIKAEKIIIDLQQNAGGQVSLAYDIIRHFFPSIVPYAGSRRRVFDTANIIGQATTSYFDSLDTDSDEYRKALSSEWVVTDLLNAETDANFSSWTEYAGPQSCKGDTFSLTQRYNLSSELFDRFMLDIDFPDCYYDDSCDTTEHWKGEDFVILTDGLCTSACALFVEMMVQEVGAKTVVVGGRPEAGAMQAVSGSRGAAAYSRLFIDYDKAFAASVDDHANSSLSLASDSGMVVASANINLRDQMREGLKTPTQFLYQPADCRLYWSLNNVHDYRQLWHDAYNGIFGDGSLCVGKSQHASRSLDERDDKVTGDYVAGGISAVKFDDPKEGGVLDTSGKYGSGHIKKCDVDSDCGSAHCGVVSYSCTEAYDCVTRQGKKKCSHKSVPQKMKVCQDACHHAHTSLRCGHGFTCRPHHSSNSNSNRLGSEVHASPGFCEPNASLIKSSGHGCKT